MFLSNLVSSITAVDTTIEVPDGTVFPQNQVFEIWVDREKMAVTSFVSANVMNVQRGWEGTVAAAHDADDLVALDEEFKQPVRTSKALDTHIDATDPHSGVYILHSLATAVSDFLVASGAGVFAKQTLAQVKTLLGIAADIATHAAIAATAAVMGHATAAQITKLDGIEAGADVTDATNVNAAGAVMESDYNAQTILQATSDNTPVALTVGEQTVVGRITSGNIVALTVAQLQTLLFSAALGAEIILGENYGIKFDAALSADGKYCGFVRTGTAGATLAFGDSVYLAVADSRWELTDADVAATSFGLLGICVQAAAADGSATTILLQGFVRADTAFPSFTIGAPVFLSTDAGDLTSTAPSGTGDCVRIVAQAWTADEIFFNPSPDWVEMA